MFGVTDLGGAGNNSTQAILIFQGLPGLQP